MTTCIHCGMNYIAEHVCTSGGPVRVSVPDYKDAALREEHTTAYMVGVEAGKDAMRAEVTKLRRYLFDLQWKPEDYTDDGELQSHALKPPVDFKTHPTERLIEACDARFKGALERSKGAVAKLREELAEARKVIEGLLDGVKGVEEGGCLDHLDCWDDAETRWYTPLEQARAFLARKEAK